MLIIYQLNLVNCTYKFFNIYPHPNMNHGNKPGSLYSIEYRLPNKKYLR